MSFGTQHTNSVVVYSGTAATTRLDSRGCLQHMLLFSATDLSVAYPRSVGSALSKAEVDVKLLAFAVFLEARGVLAQRQPLVREGSR